VASHRGARPGSLTELELERYRAARASADIVRVRNAYCMNCIRSVIGRRPMFTGFVVDKASGMMRRKLWSCASHDHMVVMAEAPAVSAAKAREKRAALKPKRPDEPR
jgi:hypothetical protein